MENKKNPQGEQPIIRTRFPRNKEVLGILEQRLGGSRARVKCLDGKTRICRIPGRLKRSLWIRENDIVLIEPWEHSSNEKGDIIFKYNKNQIHILKKKGFLDLKDNSEDLVEEF